MKKIFIFSASMLLAVFLMGKVHANEPTYPITTITHAKAQALALYKNEDYEKAYNAYERLYKDDTDAEIMLGLIYSAFYLGKIDQAIEVYEKILQKYPNDQRSLQELAFIYATKNNNFEMAKELLARTGNKAKAKKLLKYWKKLGFDTIISGNVRTGLLFNSNVTNGQNYNSFIIGDTRINMGDNETVSSMGAYFGVGLDIGKRLNSNSSWWLVGNTNLFAQYNFDGALEDLNLDSSEYGQVSGGVRYMTDENIFDFRLRGQLFDYGFTNSVVAPGVKATYLHVLTPGVHLISDATLDYYNYNYLNDASGLFVSLGQYLRIYTGSKKHSLTFGGRFLNGSANHKRFSYDGYELNLSFNFNLPYEITVNPYISYIKRNFQGKATFVETENRKDWRLQTGLNINIPINESWSVELSYKYLRNISNSHFYKYDQNVFTIGIAWAF